MSTETQAGILRPPLRAALGTLPSQQGQTLEDHIRSCHKRQVHSFADLHLRITHSAGALQVVSACTSSQASLPATCCTCMQTWSPTTNISLLLHCNLQGSRSVSPQRAKAPGLQLDLLPSELLGNVQQRSLQSLPHFDRVRREDAVAEAAARRTVTVQHGRDFVAGAACSDPSALKQPTNRILEPWQPRFDASPCDTGQQDVSAWVGGRFKSTWHPQDVLGKSLAPGEGV